VGASEEVFRQKHMFPPRLCMGGGAPYLAHILKPPEEVLPPFLVLCLVTMAAVARGSHGC
jgi:hypothetical protein